jgi:hypothetical protein
LDNNISNSAVTPTIKGQDDDDDDDDAMNREMLKNEEADHSPPASAEVKKMWLYTSTPPYAFMA